MFNILQLAQNILVTLAVLTVLIVVISAIDAAFGRVLKGFLKTLWKLALPALAIVSGIAAATSASSYKPKVDLSNSQKPVTIVYDNPHAIPSNAIPSNAIPSNAIPSNAIPSNAIPSNAIPSNAIPSNAIPSNAIPSNAIPSNILSGAKFQRLPDFGEKVCGSRRCGDNTKYTYYSDMTGEELAGPFNSNDAGEELAGSSRDSSGTISVQFYADEYALTKGECTNLHWDATGSKDVWINEIPSDISGVKQICPSMSTTYLVLAENEDGTQISTSLIIQVQEAVTVSNPGVEVAAPDRCDLFDDMDMKVTYLDWTSGAPLKFHFKMPGGVPGLGKEITGDSGIWKYSAQIGSYTSSNCEVIQGYEDRLYCTVPLPSTYSSTLRPMTLNVNECESPIYSIQAASLPAVIDSGEGSVAGGGSGDDSDGGGSGGGICGPEPADSGTPEWSDWCSCRWDNNLSC